MFDDLGLSREARGHPARPYASTNLRAWAGVQMWAHSRPLYLAEAATALSVMQARPFIPVGSVEASDSDLPLSVSRGLDRVGHVRDRSEGVAEGVHDSLNSFFARVVAFVGVMVHDWACGSRSSSPVSLWSYRPARSGRPRNRLVGAMLHGLRLPRARLWAIK